MIIRANIPNWYEVNEKHCWHMKQSSALKIILFKLPYPYRLLRQKKLIKKDIDVQFYGPSKKEVKFILHCQKN